MRTARIASAGLLLALMGCGPITMLPGGQLSGQIEPVPADWGFTDAVKTVQLETRPSDPYSVNIWGVGVGKRFYVAAGDPESRWAAHIAENPDVRLRVDQSLYELRAERSDDPGEREAFLAAVQRKYDWEPDADQENEAILFRLVAR